MATRGKRRLAALGRAVAFGFIGVLVLLQPGIGAFDIWVLFPLVTSVFSAAWDPGRRRLEQQPGGSGGIFGLRRRPGREITAYLDDFRY